MSMAPSADTNGNVTYTDGSTACCQGLPSNASSGCCISGTMTPTGPAATCGGGSGGYGNTASGSGPTCPTQTPAQQASMFGFSSA